MHKYISTSISHWVCLFWSGSPWQCQDSVSLVHCTAVTYSHSLTHIYSSSITGLDARHTQTTAGPHKNGGKTKPRAPAGRLQLVLSGARWVIMWPPSPCRHPVHTCTREEMRRIRGGREEGGVGVGGIVTFFSFFFFECHGWGCAENLDSCTWRYIKTSLWSYQREAGKGGIRVLLSNT